MAKINPLKITLDPFFTETRVHVCANTLCKFHTKDDECCMLRAIDLGIDGRCLCFEEKKEEKKN